MKIAISRKGSPETHLNVQTLSQGKPLGQREVAFILPGGPGVPLTAYKSYECLEEVVDLVFHDPRGWGESDPCDASQYHMDVYIDDVESIRQHFGLDKIHLIGKSYGSVCALGYALRYPASVKKLVLAAGSPSWRFIELAKKKIKKIGTPEQIKICEKIWTGSFETQDEFVTYFRLMQPIYSLKSRTEPMDIEKLKARAEGVALPVLNEAFKHECWHYDFTKQLPEVACKTLVLAGREDWINDISLLQAMADGIPHSQFIIFDHASHAMETDVTEEFFQRIADFLMS